MGKSYSMDLRRRVVAAVEAGQSTGAAAARFAVGKATVGTWCRLFRHTGDVAPAPQGAPRRSKLDPHEVFILGLQRENLDISLAEIVARLAAERGVKTCPSSVSYFFQKRGITFKKRQRTPPNRTGRTCAPPGKLGATSSPKSTPAA